MTNAVNIADEIVTRCNLIAGINAAREFQPILPLEELTIDAIRTVVFPAAKQRSRMTRDLRTKEFEIQILIQGKLPKDYKARAEELIEQVEDLFDSLDTDERLPISQGIVIELEHDPVFSVEHIKDKLTYTSVISLTIRTDE